MVLQTIVALVLVAGIAAFCIWVVVTYTQSWSRRPKDIANLATERSLKFADVAFIDPTAFQMLQRIGVEYVTNVISGKWAGLDVVEADINQHNRDTSIEVSIAMVRLRSPLPYLSIRHHDALASGVDRLAGLSIEFESEEFNRAYQVSADDVAFAHELVDTRMMRWLIDHPEDVVYETGSGGVLVASRQLSPKDIPSLAELAVGFTQQIPDVVHTNESHATSGAFRPSDVPISVRVGNSLVGASGVDPHSIGSALRSVLDGSWKTSPHAKRILLRSLATLAIPILAVSLGQINSSGTGRFSSIAGISFFALWVTLFVRSAFHTNEPPRD